MSIEGDQAAVERLVWLFPIPEPAAAAAEWRSVVDQSACRWRRAELELAARYRTP
jgi:hypothetical protein